MALRRFARSWAGGRLSGSMERLNDRHPWSHNDHFHSWILANLPQRCRSALDVGCGRGELLAALSSYFIEVRATDVDDAMRRHAIDRCAGLPNGHRRASQSCPRRGRSSDDGRGPASPRRHGGTS